MAAPDLTDEELLAIAHVAQREGWTDLSAPPEARRAPRTLAEEAAIARYRSAARRPRVDRGLRARLALVGLSIAVLGVCWWVSPTRTAIGLLGAALFCLIAMRRGKRRRRRGPLGA